ncbi:hypothetical protein D9M68_892590 [compost metagenome]
MVLLEPDHHGHHGGVALGEQRWEHVALFVFVVVRAGLVEVAHHVARGVTGLVVGAVGLDVCAQLAQQAQHALDPLVAGVEHFERGLEAHAG